jgi:hypothetical protein
LLRCSAFSAVDQIRAEHEAGNRKFQLVGFGLEFAGIFFTGCAIMGLDAGKLNTVKAQLLGFGDGGKLVQFALMIQFCKAIRTDANFHKINPPEYW